MGRIKCSVLNDMTTTIYIPQPAARRGLRALAASIVSLFATTMAKHLSATPDTDAAERLQLFRQVTDTCMPLISKLCYCYTSTHDDFEDLRQDVLINVWRGLAGFRNESTLPTWIYRITLNTCVATLRHETMRQHPTLDEALAASRTDEADTTYADADNVRTLYRLIKSLNPIDRGILMMWLDERSYDEIAEVMGMKRNTIATRIRRAKEELGRRWKKLQ